MHKVRSMYVAVLLGFLLLQSLQLNAQNKKTDEEGGPLCMEVVGEFDETMKSLEGNYTAKLMRDNKVLEEKTQRVNRNFKFKLRKGLLYTIKLEKAGYIPRYISISTAMPDKADLEELYEFHFATNLINEELYFHFDDDDIDFPIALVAYKKKCDCFAIDKKYTEELMNRLINKLMSGGY